MNDDISYNEQEIGELLIKASKLHESKQFCEAEELYLRLIKYLPDVWLLQYNLGLLLFEIKRYDESLIAYQRAVSLNSSNNDLYYNLAICQKACGLHENAITSYKKALKIEPDDIDSYYNLAGCYMVLNRDEDAFIAYQEILKRQPDHQPTLNNQAYLCHKMDKRELAIERYSKLLQINPDHLSADHMLAALTGAKRSSTPASYIEDVFNSYSEHYENSLLNKLQYSLPEKLRSFFERTSNRLSCSTLLDLGCGTGLTGEKFRSLTLEMHGIDLSAKMIEIAGRKGIYDELVTGEICSFLSSCQPGYYDVLLAADVFAYVGELQEIFMTSRRACSHDALLYFSVENLSGNIKNPQLKASGRFVHSDCYVKKTAETTGWQIIATETVDLRKERNSWVQGIIYGMTKKSIT